MKKKISSELAYVFGLIALAIGAALMTKGNFGITMILAPSFVIHEKLATILPSWLTQGTLEYIWEGLLLLTMMLIVRRAKWSYLFSFVTAVIFGYMLDGCNALAAFLPVNMLWRIVYFVLGVLVCATGVALVFRTYISPLVHELLLKEIASKFNVPAHRVKMGYDIFCCSTAIILSLCFFSGISQFIGWGTVICALVNGFLIGKISAFFDKHIEWVDALPLRSWFDK